MKDNIKSWEHQPTNVIKIDGNPIEVKTLPLDIQFDIQTFDKFKTDLLQIAYQQELMHHALNSKLAEINAKIKALFNKSEIIGEKNDNTGKE